jgi:hypothetical protein
MRPARKPRKLLDSGDTMATTCEASQITPSAVVLLPRHPGYTRNMGFYSASCDRITADNRARTGQEAKGQMRRKEGQVKGDKSAGGSFPLTSCNKFSISEVVEVFARRTAFDSSAVHVRAAIR